MQKAIVFLATLGPVGQKCPAPGTSGSLMGLITVVVLTHITELSLWQIGMLFIPLLIIWNTTLCTKAEEILGKTDPGEIIWDEFTAIPLVYICLPESISEEISWKLLLWLIVGFLLFRAFDILKTTGNKSHTKLSQRAWSQMCDDALAAVGSTIGSSTWTYTFSLVFFLSSLSELTKT